MLPFRTLWWKPAKFAPMNTDSFGKEPCKNRVLDLLCLQEAMLRVPGARREVLNEQGRRIQGAWVMRTLYWSGFGAILMSLPGCQLFPVTERCQDAVDHIADRTPHADHWYCAGLDLTRIGQPDWYECSLNRRLVGPQHVRGYRALPNYVHNPMPMYGGGDTFNSSPIPAVPAAESDPAGQMPPEDKLLPIRDPKQMEEGTRQPPTPALPPISNPLPLPPTSP